MASETDRVHRTPHSCCRDPLQPTVSAQITEPDKSSTKVEGSKEKPVDKTVVLEDLLGGFNEEIKVDEVDF